MNELRPKAPNLSNNQLTCMMSEAHVKDVASVNVLIKCFFDQILRFVSGQMADSVQKQRRFTQTVQVSYIHLHIVTWRRGI